MTTEPEPVPTSPLNSRDPKIKAAWQWALWKIRRQNTAAQSNPQVGVDGDIINERIPLA